MKKQKYSLWFMPPEGEKFNQFQKIITALSSEYNTPVFKPHVTLLGGIESAEEVLITKVHTLAKSVKPLKIQITGIAFQDASYRALFMLVKNTPQLINVHRITSTIFGEEETPYYMPHLSLLYGIYPERIKRKIIKDLNYQSDMTFTAEKIYIKSGNDEDVSNWSILTNVLLTGKN